MNFILLNYFYMIINRSYIQYTKFTCQVYRKDQSPFYVAY